VTVCDGGDRVSRRGEPRLCGVEDCTASAITKSDYCEEHSHHWIAAAEVPIDPQRVAGAVRRNAAEIKEATWVRVLDVYCFGGEARYLTRDGYRTLAETAGTTQMVLTSPCPGDNAARGSHLRTGSWREAEIRSFGEGPLLRVHLSRHGVRRVVRATPDHLWFAGEGPLSRLRRLRTDELVRGHVLGTVVPRDNLRGSQPSPFGIAAGVVFGDGSRANLRGTSNGSLVDLWGEKNAELLRYFNHAPTLPIKIERSGVLGTRVTGLPTAFKDRPSLDEGVSYLYGWLAGYFAADGSVARAGSVSLYSASEDDLRYAEAVASRLGIVTLGISTSTRSGFGRPATELHALRFARGFALRPEFFLISEHRRRYAALRDRASRMRWRVEAVEDLGERDEVFCAVVPEDETFVLEGNVWTHNCQHCRKNYLDARTTPCSPYSTVLRGGPLGTRKKRMDADEATMGV
jgi:DNA primase